MRRNQTIEEQLSPAASPTQLGISGRGERRTGGLHPTKPGMFLARRKKPPFVRARRQENSREQPRETPAQLGTHSPVALMAQRPVFSTPCQSFWAGGREFPNPERLFQGAPPRIGARLLGPGSVRSALGRGAPPHALPQPRPPRASPVAAPPAMSRGSRLALAVSALFSAAIVAAVHIQQRRELEVSARRGPRGGGGEPSLRPRPPLSGHAPGHQATPPHLAPCPAPTVGSARSPAHP